MKLNPDMDINLIMSAIARLRTPVEIVDALTVALQRERGWGAPREIVEALSVALERERGWSEFHPAIVTLRRCADILARAAADRQPGRKEERDAAQHGD